MGEVLVWTDGEGVVAHMFGKDFIHSTKSTFTEMVLANTLVMQKEGASPRCS